MTSAILAKFRRCTIGVVGDLMLDRYVTGEVERISPEAPAPVVRFRSEEFHPGGAANTAANVAALGAKTMVFGAIGDDQAGGILLRFLNAEGIDTGGVVRTAKSTIEKTRIIAMGQQIVRLDREDDGGLDKESKKLLFAKFSEAVGALDAVVISDYDKGVITADFARLILRLAQRERLPVIVAPKPAHFSFFRGARVIVPNKKEAEGIIGHTIDGEANLLKVGKALARRAHAPVLITRGREGMSLFTPPLPVGNKGPNGKRGVTAGFENGKVRHIPSAAREVYDVTGAGDTVAAALTLAIACGKNIYEAALLANAAAGIVVGKRGTATVSPEELRNAFTKVSDGRQIL